MHATRNLDPLPLFALLALLALASAPAAGAVTSGTKSPRPAKKAAPAHSVVPFIADDLDRALADARKTHRPVFVESWAPW